MDTIESTVLQERLVAALYRSRMPIAVAYLFGSHATNRTWAESDVDVAVLFGDADAGSRTKLANELADELSRALDGVSVDVLCIMDRQEQMAVRGCS